MRKDLYQDLYNLENSHWWHVSKRRAVFKMIKKYSYVSKPKILDVGCGTGRSLEEFKKIGTVFGLDNSSEALKYCKKRGLKNLILGSAEETHLQSGYFDVITLLDVLEHTDDVKTLKEMQRILKKNGIIIITVPAFNCLWSKWDQILQHKRRYTINSLRKQLLLNNLTPVKMTYLFSFLVSPSWLIRQIKQLFLKDFYPSDFKLSNPLFNFLLNSLSKLEFFIAENFFVPFGTSVLTIAKKNE